MIISASYKTDIPALYGEWFRNRLRAGYCKMVNPYGRQVYTVDLRREAVDGFVFWTRNIGPFLPVLEEVRQRGYPFAVQYTITGYPRELEEAVVAAEKSVENARHLADKYGPRSVVWRYDTIVCSSLTPREFHLRNFERLARRLQGATDEVVISFAHIYRKTHRNMMAAADEAGFSWWNPPAEEKRSLTLELVGIAQAQGMQLSICSQRDYLVPGAADAKCIDAGRLGDVAGSPVCAALKGNRPDCGCHQSRDIGEYDTCTQGCVYCYAVQNRATARRRFRQHDPESEFLFRPQATPAATLLPLPGQ